MIYYLVSRRHAYSLNDLLATWGKALAGRIGMVLYEDLFSGATVRLPPATYIFTSLGSGMGSRRPLSPVRKLASDLHRHLVQVCGPERVLNDPAHFLSRVELLEALHERGINRFEARRVNGGAGPGCYPVFLRADGGSVRQAPPLLRNRDEYDAAVRGAAGTEELIAVEFRDTADPSGLYRKYASFVVGGRIIPRHLFFSRSWLVKHADVCEPGMVEEELRFMASNAHEALLGEVCRIANISYGRVDYALLDGQPQIWEINSTPALVTLPAADHAARAPVNERFVRLFAEALDAIDPPA